MIFRATFGVDSWPYIVGRRLLERGAEQAGRRSITFKSETYQRLGIL